MKATPSSVFKVCFSTLFVLTMLTANAQPLEPVPGPKGLYGYKNSQTGELVIPFQYDIAYPFTNGFAYVAIDSIGSYMDKTGLIVASGSVYAPSIFSQGLAAIRTAVDDDYKYGYVDTTGAWAIPPIFDTAYPFSRGLAAVSIHDRFYYINTEGNIVIDLDFIEAYPFSGELALVKSREKSLWGCIDTTGKLIINYRYNAAGHFSEGMAPVQWGEFWGFISDKGLQTVSCQYETVSTMRNNRALVVYNNLGGYIDRNGILVIPAEYIRASPFINGLACVYKDRRWGYIDTLGKMVIKPQFESANFFSDGLACVRKGRYGYIDPTGKVVIKYRYRDALNFSQGLARVGNGRTYGFIDVQENLVIPMEYDDAGRFDHRGLAQVTKNGQTYYINKRGQAVKTRDLLHIDEKPKFQGRDQNTFSDWVKNQIKYPPDAEKIGIQGTVYLTFCIDTDGSLIDVQVLQGVHPDIDREAIRVVSSSPKWTPGKKGDKPVKKRCYLPIHFHLRVPQPVR
ncbi:MAG: TonB family protein [Bacteroidales bacterium]|nr:TonB family protein [Bacteroidales bacterium]